MVEDHRITPEDPEADLQSEAEMVFYVRSLQFYGIESPEHRALRRAFKTLWNQGDHYLLDDMEEQERRRRFDADLQAGGWSACSDCDVCRDYPGMAPDKDARGCPKCGHAFGGCSALCDCENPEHANGGVALISNECPIHNLYPSEES